MLRTFLLLLAFSISLTMVYSQVKVGDSPMVIDSASLIEIESTSKGFLPSRMTSAQRDLQLSWKQGHIIYNLSESCLQIYSGTSWDCLIQGVDTSLFTYNGTLNSDRILTLGGYGLTFDGTGLGDIIVTSNGDLGIGDLTPEALLDVEGGTVRFSDYGLGTITGTPTYLLGFDAQGDILEVGLNSVGTDDQTIDTFSLISNIVSLSLEGDGETAKTIDLSGYLDDISIYNDDGTLSANRTITTGGNTLNFSNVGNVTTFDPSGTDLTLTSTLTADLRLSSNSKTLDLSVTPGSSADALITAGNGVDDLIITNTNTTAGSELQLGTSNVTKLTLRSTGQLNLTEYGIGTFDDSSPSRLLGVQTNGDIVDVNPIVVGTDDQVIDTFSLSGNTLSLSLESDGEIAKTVDLSSYLDNTDSQDLSLAGNTLSLTGDATNVDLSAYLDNVDIYSSDGSLSGVRTVTMNGSSLTFDGTGTGDVIIEADGDVGIGDTTPEARLDVEGGSLRLSNYGIGTYDLESETYLLGVQADGDVIEVDLADYLGGGGGGTGDTINIYNTSDTLTGARTVTMNGNSLTFDGTGAGDVIIEADGDVGIGDTTPEARLDVEGGNVRFSNYGLGTYKDTTAAYLMGIEADGDLIELNTFINSRWFYAPAVTIDASAVGTALTIDLHQEYVDQFSQPQIKSVGAPNVIPFYTETNLYYYITFFDSSVLSNVSISATGVMTYDIIDVPFDNYTIVNVIFVIK